MAPVPDAALGLSPGNRGHRRLAAEGIKVAYGLFAPVGAVTRRLTTDGWRLAALAALHDLEPGPVEILPVLHYAGGHQEVSLVLDGHLQAVADVVNPVAHYHAEFALLVRRAGEQDRALRITARFRDPDRDGGAREELDADLPLLVLVARDAADEPEAPLRRDLVLDSDQRANLDPVALLRRDDRAVAALADVDHDPALGARRGRLLAEIERVAGGGIEHRHGVVQPRHHGD